MRRAKRVPSVACKGVAVIILRFYKFSGIKLFNFKKKLLRMSKNSGKSCSQGFEKLDKKCFFDSFFGFNRIFQGAMNEKIIAHQKKVAQIER